jgi:hypothetical protein
VIHVATAHVGSARWLSVQLRYLRHTMTEPYDVFASLEDVDPGDLAGDIVAFEHRGPHAGKLNLLAAEIGAASPDEDLVMFLDGDAFPVADPAPVIRAALASTDLVAVQRLENAGDRQPHPSFCVTSVGTWRRLQGDWSAGFSWVGSNGSRHSDVGGNLLRLLEVHGLEWTPLLRSNTVDLHPVWFGVYGGVVYHHGAGFRAAKSRHDLTSAPRPVPAVPGLRRLARSVDARRLQRWSRATAGRAGELSETLFAEIEVDFDFYRRFLDSAPATPAGAGD